MKNGVSMLLAIIAMLTVSCSPSKNQELAQKILQDERLQQVDSMAHELLKQGFNAGSGYSEIWARDLNTFILTSLDVVPAEELREALLIFFRIQQPNGEMVDGYVVNDGTDMNARDTTVYYSALAPNHIGFKNTVETDQETSLIQAVYKYVTKTGDQSILTDSVGEYTVTDRIHRMIDFLRKERWSQDYGLLFGGTTADWGDCQPVPSDAIIINQDIIDLNQYSHLAIDIYDNAMFLIALDDMKKLGIATDEEMELYQEVKQQARKHLWDAERQKFRPHIYLAESPIPEGFNEEEVYYHGGTAVAIEAGLLSKEEVAKCNEDMVHNVEVSGMPTIGLTIYPPYPEDLIPGANSKPYSYQNGGDWTWFGGRMIQQLIAYGYVEEAYSEMEPMLDRVIENGDFNEWWGPGNKPSGSGRYKGSAGVLSTAIQMLTEWCHKQ